MGLCWDQRFQLHVAYPHLRENPMSEVSTHEPMSAAVRPKRSIPADQVFRGGGKAGRRCRPAPVILRDNGDIDEQGGTLNAGRMRKVLGQRAELDRGPLERTLEPVRIAALTR
jgi:hypothetical protein